MFFSMAVISSVLEQCSDGTTGNGKCTCNSNFNGTACEACTSPYDFGPQCKSGKTPVKIYILRYRTYCKISR